MPEEENKKDSEEPDESEIEPPNPKRRVPPRNYLNVTLYKCKKINPVISKSSIQMSNYVQAELNSTLKLLSSKEKDDIQIELQGELLVRRAWSQEIVRPRAFQP